MKQPGLAQGIGVVTDPDGEHYAVAVLTRAHQPFERRTEINGAMAAAVVSVLSELRRSA